MRLGVVVLPEDRWASARSVWSLVESVGFEHAWTYDHLAWRTLRDRPWFSTIPVLTAAALTTSTIRLGTLVASPNFRHPVTFAKDLVALDDISGGRVIAGIGAGGTGWDADMLGQRSLDAHERADRFAEFVQAVDLMLRQSEASYHGEYFTAVDARTHPGCVQQPRVPLAIAATGRRGMELAARYGEFWVTTGNPRDTGPLPAAIGARSVAVQVQRLERACEGADRDPASIRRLVVTGGILGSGLGSADEFEETLALYSDVGVTDMVLHWPRRDPPYEGDPERMLSIVGPHLRPT